MNCFNFPIWPLVEQKNIVRIMKKMVEDYRLIVTRSPSRFDYDRLSVASTLMIIQFITIFTFSIFS